MGAAVEFQNAVRPAGALSLKVSERPMTYFRHILEATDPGREKSLWLRRWKERNLPNIFRGLDKIRIAEEHGLPMFFGVLHLKQTMNDGDIIDYGLVSCRVVTTAGVNAMVDAFQNTVELETFKYHGIGLGTNAEAVGDTGLQTELTTQLNPDNVRATGTTTEGATANVYRTVATNSVDATVAVTEHGIFTVATVNTGTLLDRTVFAAVNMVSGNTLQSQYDFTISAGG